MHRMPTGVLEPTAAAAYLDDTLQLAREVPHLTRSLVLADPVRILFLLIHIALMMAVTCRYFNMHLVAFLPNAAIMQQLGNRKTVLLPWV